MIHTSIALPVSANLSMLQQVLSGLADDQFSKPLDVLGNASIGEHTRHVIEFFQALIRGYQDGIVNYDKRLRNHTLQTDADAAIQELAKIQSAIDKPDKSVRLIGAFAEDGDQEIAVHTTYYRELIYNQEHMIHHMAIIRIAIRHTTSLQLPTAFGIASSTVRYKKSIL